MMMKILIALVSIILFSSYYPLTDELTVYDQNPERMAAAVNDEVNIREMVNEQIQASKQKHFNGFMATSLREIIEVESKDNNNVDQPPVNKAIVFGVADLSVIIFLIAVVLTVIVIVFRRIKNRRTEDENEISPVFSMELLKRNIAMIRNEDPVLNRKESYLSNKRRNLKNVSFEKLNENISVTAKELRLSKGEILLTSSIKNFEREKAWNRIKGMKRTNRLAEI